MVWTRVAEIKFLAWISKDVLCTKSLNFSPTKGQACSNQSVKKSSSFNISTSHPGLRNSQPYKLADTTGPD